MAKSDLQNASDLLQGFLQLQQANPTSFSSLSTSTYPLKLNLNTDYLGYIPAKVTALLSKDEQVQLHKIST